MDYSPKFSAANNSIPSTPKSRPVIKWIRRILLAVIVGVAFVTLGWFLYDKFFNKGPVADPYNASREGIANTIRAHTVPVPDAVRLELGNNIRQHAPIASTTKSGEVINTAPIQQRQIISNMMHSHQ